MKENSNIIYIKSDNLLHDAQQIIETAQKFAYRAVNVAMVQRNWLLGKRITEEEFQGKDRAEYGAEIIKKLSFELTQIYGKGFDYSSLYKFVDFYKAFPNIFHTVCGKFENEIFHSVSGKSENAILDSLSPKSFSFRINNLCGTLCSLFLCVEKNRSFSTETQRTLRFTEHRLQQ